MPCQWCGGILMCPGGACGPPRGGRPTFGTTSGSAKANESVFVEQHNSYNYFWCGQNWCVSFSWEIVHATLQITSWGICETCPISRAYQHVMSVIDLNVSACSSKCEHHILAASQSTKQALLHCEREGGVWTKCQYIGCCQSWTVNMSWLSHSVTHMYICFQKLCNYFNM